MDKPKFESQPEIARDMPSLVRNKERELFPEFQNEDYGYVREGRGDELNFYFTPSHHFRRGLINEEILRQLQQGKNLISFGAGKAYLEQLLVKEFNVNAGQITLTDKNAIDFPEGMEGHQIDMHGEWPAFGKKYSFAIFPESFTSLLAFERRYDQLGKDSPLVEAVCNLIQRCFEILDENGEVRVDGHCMRDDELYLIQNKLATTGISLAWDPSLLVAKKISATSANNEYLATEK